MERDDESEKGGHGMAITQVTAELSDEITQLQNTSGDDYSGSLTAPYPYGDYDVEVQAYDDAGNITTATKELKVTKWRTPKVDWKPTDRFNFVDYNRIKNNLEYLHERAVQLYRQFSIADMGEDILVYTAYWNVDVFNLFEKNLETINKNAYTQDFGVSQTFYPNGVFIKYDELNHIESAILSIRMVFDNQEAGLRRIPFRLGAFKEARV